MRLLGVQIAYGHSPEARVFAGLLRHRSDRYEALVLHHDWPGDTGNAGKFEAGGGVPVARFDAGWRPNSNGRRSRLARLASLVRFRLSLPRMLEAAGRFEPDVVYSSQQRWDCLAASYIAARLRRPQVIHLHYAAGPWLGRQPLRRLRECAQVVTVADFIADEAIRCGSPPERVTTVRNPMTPAASPPEGARDEVRAELGLPAGAPLIGIVARLVRDKGQDSTIAAFTRIAGSHPEARLLIVGAGPYREELERQARVSGLAERILFSGRRSDVPRILAALDVFSHPSRLDACPLALLEACGSGLPAVGYDEAGVPEIIASGETGLLAPPDDIDALAGCFARLLDEPESARRMGRAGRERVARLFRPETVAGQFADIVERVAAGRQAVSV